MKKLNLKIQKSDPKILKPEPHVLKTILQNKSIPVHDLAFTIKKHGKKYSERALWYAINGYRQFPKDIEEFIYKLIA